MGIYNNITLHVFSSGTTEITNVGLDKAENITMTQVYPGGKSAGMNFFVPRDVTASWLVQNGQRITAWNGLVMVWEGYILNIAPAVSDSRMGMNVICEGAWSRFLQRKRTRKPWADTRIDETALPPTMGSAYPDLVTIDRQAQIKIIPKIESWAASLYGRVTYTAPTGQTIKRVTCNYDLQKGAQTWKLGLFNDTSGGDQWSVAVSGAGALDTGTFATPATSVGFYFQNSSAGVQTATGPSGTIYGRFWNIVIYTEIGSINAQTITTKIASMAGLSVDATQIGAETVSLVPFIANGFETYADLLSRAASYGDASFNKWAPWVDFSQNASDGLPRLVLEQQPTLTAFDYVLSMGDLNVDGQLQFVQDLDSVRNWIIVQYNDANNRQVYVAPDDDATLKDASSITSWGERHEQITLSTTDVTAAKNYAKRLLAARKDPQWVALGSLAVNGYIRGSSATGQNPRVPTSQIQPGKRVKIENWLNDISGTGAGLTFLITGTTYTDADEKCALEIGIPNSLEVTLLRLSQK